MGWVRLRTVVGWMTLVATTVILHASVEANAQTNVAAPPPSAAAFAALPFIERPALSPDGKNVAALLGVDGKQYFGVFSLFDKSRPPTLSNVGDLDVLTWAWVNDDWLVLTIGTQKPGPNGSPIFLTRALGISRDGGKPVPLGWKGAAQAASDILWIARDGSPTVLLARQTSLSMETRFFPEIDRIDVSTGALTTAAGPTDGVWDWYADASGTVRAGIKVGYDGTTWHLIYRNRPVEDFRFSPIFFSKKTPIVAPVLFLSAPTKAIALSDRDGYDAIYALDLGTMTLGERLYGAQGHDIDHIVPSLDGTALDGFVVDEDRLVTHWISPQEAALQALIDKAVGDAHATIVSRSRDGEALLVKVGMADEPGRFYYFAPKEGRMHLVGQSSSVFAGKHFAAVSTVHYKARDGLDISAVLTLPRDRPAKALPLIVMPHGGPYARDDERWDWWVQFLATSGYAVIQPNYRGSSGFGTAFAKKGEGQWGLAMQDDLDDAITYLAREGIADPKRVCMVGASYGGYAAMRAAERDGALFRCAISYAGVSDLVAIKNYDSNFFGSGARITWLKTQAPDLRAVSPINDIAGFSTPILLVHGKKDLRVPFSQSRSLAAKLKAAGKTVVFVEQPLGDHNFSREADRLQFLQSMQQFLAQYNPA